MSDKRRQSTGRCMLCKKSINKGQMTRHVKKCAEQHSEDGGRSMMLFHLVVEGKHLPMYWLHLEMPGAMTLAHLDRFLRDIWLECCGHLSCFTIEGQRYSISPAEDSLFGPREETMNQKLYSVLEKGMTFHHEYDYGSTTELKLRVVDVRKRKVKMPGVVLLARNEPPAWTCARCGKPATRLRSTGWGPDPESLLCAGCGCDEDEECMLMPLVNSPRTGVCGYCGSGATMDEPWSQEEESTTDDDEVGQVVADGVETVQPDIGSWRRLYAAADQIMRLAPWRWLLETDVFGVQFPGTDEIGYVSIMGNIGEHYAVSVYLGDEALTKFWDIESAPQIEDNTERILELPQLMASFEDRDMLEKADREIIRQLGLQYRGKRNWPLFRSYRPGFYPWFLEQNEVEKLATALEQAIGLAMRLEDRPELLKMERGCDFLVRVCRKRGSDVVWEDSVRELTLPEPSTLNFRIDHAAIDEFESLPADAGPAEVAFFLAPGRVGTPGQRPSFTYLLLAVEPESCHILGLELFQALDGLHRMWEEIPAKLVSILNKAGFAPDELQVSSPRLHEFLAPIFGDLGIRVSLWESLPAVEEVKESLWEFMAGRS